MSLNGTDLGRIISGDKGILVPLPQSNSALCLHTVRLNRSVFDDASASDVENVKMQSILREVYGLFDKSCSSTMTRMSA